ncbi:MAG: Arc family DNA-binding protein [Patulibacter sp.]
MATVSITNPTVPMRARTSTRDRVRQLAEMHGRSMVDELDALVEQQFDRLLLNQMLEGMAQDGSDSELAEWQDAPLASRLD